LVIWILIVAAIISGALGEWPEALAILAIVLLNGVLGKDFSHWLRVGAV
jgi:Ca2+-transporting ATPase